MTKIKWSKRKLKALKGSIVKWEKIVAGTGVDEGMLNCPLCQYYVRCLSCPVRETTGESYCRKTPWTLWLSHRWKTHRKIETTQECKRKIECSTCKKLAKKELTFLKNLLPKEAL